MEIRVTHQGRLLAELEIFPDGQLQVRSVQPGNPYVGGPPPAAAAQYVWGSQQPAAQPAAQYVWGSQQAPEHSAAQYVWGATNSREGGLNQTSVTVDYPSMPTAGIMASTTGMMITEGLLPR